MAATNEQQRLSVGRSAVTRPVNRMDRVRRWLLVLGVSTLLVTLGVLLLAAVTVRELGLVRQAGAMGAELDTAVLYVSALGILTSLLLLAQLVIASGMRWNVRRELADIEQRATNEQRSQQRVEAQLLIAKEAAETANQAKTDFVSQISHELKHPLTIVSGYADLLAVDAGGVLNEEQLKFVEAIQIGVTRMDRLVSDLSDVSRMESGRLLLEPARVEVDGVATEIREMVMRELGEQRQELTLEIEAGLPAVWADRARLQQILLNLVGNGSKYSPAGSTICFSARSGAADGFVELAVRDSGPGILPVDQDHVFDRFYRSHDRRRREVPGTGLGLSIARHLVEMHGGKIWFETARERGTTFYFTLPTAAST